MLKGFVNDWNVKLFSFRLNFSTIGSLYAFLWSKSIFFGLSVGISMAHNIRPQWGEVLAQLPQRWLTEETLGKSDQKTYYQIPYFFSNNSTYILWKLDLERWKIQQSYVSTFSWTFNEDSLKTFRILSWLCKSSFETFDQVTYWTYNNYRSFCHYFHSLLSWQTWGNHK